MEPRARNARPYTRGCLFSTPTPFRRCNPRRDMVHYSQTTPRRPAVNPLDKLPLPLLEWFRDNARSLPWRDDPTPYHVWLSEIMLQQTRVAAVLGF